MKGNHQQIFRKINQRIPYRHAKFRTAVAQRAQRRRDVIKHPTAAYLLKRQQYGIQVDVQVENQPVDDENRKHGSYENQVFFLFRRHFLTRLLFDFNIRLQFSRQFVYRRVFHLRRNIPKQRVNRSVIRKQFGDLIFYVRTALNHEKEDSITTLSTLFSALASIQDCVHQTEQSTKNTIFNALHYLENNYFNDIHIEFRLFTRPFHDAFY